MKIEKFNIYSADLNPKFGTEPGKKRPIVVIQTNLMNNEHKSTIICPITTKVIKYSEILRVNLNEKINGLKKNSDIIIDQIRAIDNKKFINFIGKLNKKQKVKLLDNLKIIILE